MTREEIIEQLNLAIGLIKQNGWDWLDDRDIPMLEECVKALENHDTFMKYAYLQGKQDALSQESCDVFDKYGNYKYPSDVELTEPNTATSMPCDNAISREDRLIDLANAIESDDSGYWTNKRISSVLRNIPSVTQKSGKWILQPSNKEQGERDFIWWKCSECGHVIYSETEKDRREYHAFCGRCGARMDEPQESEESDG